jgi:hypothetical protein
MCAGGQHVAAAGYDYLKSPASIDLLADVFAALMIELEAFHWGTLAGLAYGRLTTPTSHSFRLNIDSVKSVPCITQIILCRAVVASRGPTECPEGRAWLQKSPASFWGERG